MKNIIKIIFISILCGDGDVVLWITNIENQLLLLFDIEYYVDRKYWMIFNSAVNVIIIKYAWPGHTYP